MPKKATDLTVAQELKDDARVLITQEETENGATKERLQRVPINQFVTAKKLLPYFENKGTLTPKQGEDSVDLDAIRDDNCVYSLISSVNYEHYPATETIKNAFLLNIHNVSMWGQILITYTTQNSGSGNMGHLWYRSGQNRQYNPWKRINTTYSEFNAAVSKINSLQKITDILIRYNNADLIPILGVFENKTSGGVTYTWSDGVCVVTSNGSTVSAVSFNNIIESPNVLPDGIIPGEKYTVRPNTSSSSLMLQIYYYLRNGTNTHIDLTTETNIEIPNDTVGIIVRIRSKNRAVIDATIQPEIIKYSSDNNTLRSIGFADTNTDLNNLPINSFCLLASGRVYDNAPFGMGFITTLGVDGYNVQQGISIELGHVGEVWYRRKMKSQEWNAWTMASGGGGGDNKTIIENTYNIETTPHITVDDNGWLVSSGDTTDMTGAIMSLLTDTGVARLGPGIFYTTGIEMPANTRIEGCGNRTILILDPAVDTGYAIKISKYNEIANIRIRGTELGTQLDFTSNSVIRGTRDGVHFTANYDADPSVQSEQCFISNAWIQNFSGAGIIADNTSINYAKGLYVSDTKINNCYAGIDINYRSEFNKFCNVCIAWCRIACLNNSGNNGFVSCTFHATEKGFVMDNSDNTHPNNSHGYMTGCTFCHIGSNKGKAIYVVNQVNGFVFSACQIWYDSVEIVDSSGITFNGMEFGRGTTGGGATIRISGGGLVLFNGCIFQNDVAYPPEISIANNDKVRFVACYGSSSGNAIDPVID